MFCGTSEAAATLDQRIESVNAAYSRGHYSVYTTKPHIEDITKSLVLPEQELVRGMAIRVYSVDLDVHIDIAELAYNQLQANLRNFAETKKNKKLRIDYKNTLPYIVESAEFGGPLLLLQQAMFYFESVKGARDRRDEEILAHIQALFNLVAGVQPPRHIVEVTKPS